MFPLRLANYIMDLAMRPEETAYGKVERLQSLFNRAKRVYEECNPNSRRLHLKALNYLPGGNTRSVLHTEPFPVYMERGEGNRLIDVDGHESV